MQGLLNARLHLGDLLAKPFGLRFQIRRRGLGGFGSHGSIIRSTLLRQKVVLPGLQCGIHLSQLLPQHLQRTFQSLHARSTEGIPFLGRCICDQQSTALAGAIERTVKFFSQPQRKVALVMG